MDQVGLERLLLDLRRRHPDLDWSMEPDYDGVGSTAYLSRRSLKDRRSVTIVELYPGVPSVRAHVDRSFVFEELADAELPEFLEAVLAGRMRRLPPLDWMGRILRVKSLCVEGRDRAWIASR